MGQDGVERDDEEECPDPEAAGQATCMQGRGLYDTRTDVVSVMEVIPDGSMKLLFRVIDAAVVLGTGLLFVLFGMKLSTRFDSLRQSRPVVILNAAVAAIDVAVLAGCLAVFGGRLWIVRRAGLRWSSRRLRWTIIFSIQLVAVFFGNVFFLVPNLYVVTRECDFFNGVVNISGLARWTALNTVLALWVVQARSFNLWVDRLGHPLGKREDDTYIDAPWRANWFVAVYWVVFEAFNVLNIHTYRQEIQGKNCKADWPKCPPPTMVIVFASTLVALAVGYLLMFVYCSRRAFVLLAKKSYVQFRWVNISLRYTFRMVGLVLLFGILSFAFLWFSRFSSCLSFVTSWLGFVPLQMTLTFFMVVNTIIYLPLMPGCRLPIRALPCSASWLERIVDEQRIKTAEDPDFSPSFCFETAVKLVYWCEFMYHYDPEGGVQEKKGFSLEKGQELYGLTHIDSLVAKDTDTRVVISWNNAGTILVCFRGTSSKANVVADLKFWRTPHPPGRGLTMLSMIPMVHKGFLDSWTAKGFNHKLLEKIRSIMGSPEFDYPKLRILVSGHSLGGAIAVLAAHDIRRYCAVKPHQLSCYTFGCPRVGNHMFADEHNRVVPDTWHVINNLDPVPRMPKFWVLFKRSGRRVVINAHGDMIVQPIFLEFKLVSAFMGKTKVVHHWLSSYRRSLSSVVLAQFHTYKALPGGSEAMKELLQKGNITQVLGVNTGSANKLLTLASKIWMQRSHNMDLDNVGPDGKPIRVSQRSISGWLPSSLLRIGRRGSSSSSIDLSTELRRPGTSRKLTLREEGVSRSGLTNFAEELEEWEVQEMDAEMEDGEPNQPDREEAP